MGERTGVEGVDGPEATRLSPRGMGTWEVGLVGRGSGRDEEDKIPGKEERDGVVDKGGV